MEVDAASKTKVEDTRELLDNVQYLPTRGRFKIYLIDEVHMLSGHSFNALLKTLEEPPAHVKFLLATTDPQKLPVTILSRCLQFHLRPLPFEQIVSHLEFVLNKENAQFEINGLKMLSRAADGSLRDALSLLDQALAYGQGRVEAEGVRAMLGLSKPAELRALLQSILHGDPDLALQNIARLKAKNADFTSVLLELQTLLHQMSIAKVVPLALDDSILEKEQLLELATEFSHDTLQLYYQIALVAQRDIAYAPTPQMGIEMMVLRMIAFRPMEVCAVPHHAAAVANNHAAKTLPLKAEVLKAKVSLETKESAWSTLIRSLPLTGMVKVMAEHCTVETWTADAISLILSESQKPLLNKRNEERLNEALNLHFNKTLRLRIQSGQNKGETPAKQNQRIQDEKFVVAQKSINENPHIQKLIQTFEGSIEEVNLVSE
jgi:DNA polymerase-3 subunit gamma/tau